MLSIEMTTQHAEQNFLPINIYRTKYKKYFIITRSVEIYPTKSKIYKILHKNTKEISIRSIIINPLFHSTVNNTWTTF